MKRALLVGVVLLGAVALLAHGQTEPEEDCVTEADLERARAAAIEGAASIVEVARVNERLVVENVALLADVERLACVAALWQRTTREVQASIAAAEELDLFELGRRSVEREREITVLSETCFEGVRGRGLSPAGMAALNRAEELFGLELTTRREPGE